MSKVNGGNLAPAPPQGKGQTPAPRLPLTWGTRVPILRYGRQPSQQEAA